MTSRLFIPCIGIALDDCGFFIDEVFVAVAYLLSRSSTLTSHLESSSCYCYGYLWLIFCRRGLRRSPFLGVSLVSVSVWLVYRRGLRHSVTVIVTVAYLMSRSSTPVIVTVACLSTRSSSPVTLIRSLSPLLLLFSLSVTLTVIRSLILIVVVTM